MQVPRGGGLSCYGELNVDISLSVSVDGQLVLPLEADLLQILADLKLTDQVRVERR
jgi:hypothetical protein